eukprot:TRINITY_DN4758_c0_g1_i1.p1 TRINITY_DN4758_c0_g1~~TRINITY_DN4758_c0_g1_i1.p1  ORF type:complete len:503 (-),score=137.21 TRINITY_DN4758_c0_g1_i1:1108-2616(-)
MSSPGSVARRRSSLGSSLAASSASVEGPFVPAILGGGRKRRSDVFSIDASSKRRKTEEECCALSASPECIPVKRVPLASISESQQNVRLSPLAQSIAVKRSPSSSAKTQVSSLPGPDTHTLASATTLHMRPSWSEFRRFIHQVPESSDQHRSSQTPFPELSWADRTQLWKLMIKKESGVYRRLPGELILQRHPSFQPRMRAILLDWLIEVCEVYRLHRETFYLAVDFIDRYLSLTVDMPKNKLQLIGVSCLFIGAKIEEIYPPKLKEFAYVTDGACSEEQILEMELVILKALNWSLCPLTPNAWMKLFLQLNSGEGKPRNESLLNSQFSGLPFSRIMQLMDLCTMDIGSLSFKYSVLVAAALYHFENEQVALESSGYEWKDISSCVNWMSAFAFALREQCPLQPRTFHNVPSDNQHNIQTHTVELTMLDRAQERLVLLMTTSDPDSPDPEDLPAPIHLGSLELTPPEEEGDVNFHPAGGTSLTPSQESKTSGLPPSPQSQDW